MNTFRTPLAAAFFFMATLRAAFPGELEDAYSAERRGDYATAVKLFDSLAAQSDPSAQLALGLMHTRGKGVPPNLDEGLKWFRLAAENPAASQTTRDDAIYNRDFLSRKMKKLAEATTALGPPAKASRAHTDPSLTLVGPAPDGEATIVAQRIILDNFDPPDCPLVMRALRLGDGSIKASCSNGESYRIFSFQNKQLAMRCSVANKFGAGC